MSWHGKLNFTAKSTEGKCKTLLVSPMILRKLVEWVHEEVEEFTICHGVKSMRGRNLRLAFMPSFLSNCFLLTTYNWVLRIHTPQGFCVNDSTIVCYESYPWHSCTISCFCSFWFCYWFTLSFLYSAIVAPADNKKLEHRKEDVLPVDIKLPVKHILSRELQVRWMKNQSLVNLSFLSSCSLSIMTPVNWGSLNHYVN